MTENTYTFIIVYWHFKLVNAHANYFLTVVKMDGFWVKQCIVVNFESTLPTRAGIWTSRILGLWEHDGDTVVSRLIAIQYIIIAHRWF